MQLRELLSRVAALPTSRQAFRFQPDLKTWHGALLRDAALDVAMLPSLLRADRLTAAQDSVAKLHDVHVLAVVREENRASWEMAERELRRSRHTVTFRITGVFGEGKFGNLNKLLDSSEPLPDWLLLMDDDVVLPPQFLDTFLLVAEQFRLRIAQPAHCITSHASWPITKRRRAVARLTNFVEIGPITALHECTLSTLTPFPTEGMGWGLDHQWARTAETKGWRAGIVDLTPIVHLSPAASTYDAAQAAEGREPGNARPPATLATYRRWPARELAPLG
ncbi:MAG: hypothetical protein ACRDRD_13120 [Pseudonocardiaceae bacterium]